MELWHGLKREEIAWYPTVDQTKCISVAAIIGGYVGNLMMHYRLTAQQLKKLIAVVLLLLAAKILWNLLGF